MVLIALTLCQKLNASQRIPDAAVFDTGKVNGEMLLTKCFFLILATVPRVYYGVIPGDLSSVHTSLKLLCRGEPANPALAG